MSTNDYVKFVTQQFVKFIDQPKDVRKATKQQRKEEQEPLTNRWFGIMPLAVSLMFKKNKKRES
ncbi:YqzE family protein [Bacillus sp. REN16]|uniref:YqzE family protein n=1 Tax=Bacillus sp. REN16 TaxID=2887296 RepID=UPI001E3AFAFD|nr:YqzE family protein [Bacillus sp. REN16]MCC3356745.1 YqzE family protein [Bacillus sp. REN16]